MDLRQSLIIEALGKPVAEGCVCEAPRVRAEQIAKQVFAMAKQNGSPFLNIDHKQWAKKWLASDEFVLTEIDASSVAIPMAPKNTNKVFTNIMASATSLPPVVVDLNKRGIGRAPGSGYIPPVIVVDGKHRATAININGRETIKAWVGVKALDKVTKASIDFKPTLRKPLPQSKIDTVSQLYSMGAPVPAQDRADENGSSPKTVMPGVKATGPAMEPVTKGQSGEVMGGGPGSGRRPGGRNWGKQTDIEKKTANLNPEISDRLRQKSRLPNDEERQAARMSNPRPRPAQGTNGRPYDPGWKTGIKGHAGGGTGGPGGMTSGPTPKILGDASDTSSVIDPSDENYPPEASDTKQGMKYKQAQTSTSKCQNNDLTGKVTKTEGFRPSNQGNGAGPMLKPNHGASRSDLSKVMAGKVGNIKTVAPPGFSEATMHKLKRQHGVKNAFKIAWSQHNKKG